MYPWTDEKVELLKRRHLEGQSYSVIARELGGISAASVCNKVHRLGLPIRETKQRSNFGKGAGKKAARLAITRRKYGVRGDALPREHALSMTETEELCDKVIVPPIELTDEEVTRIWIAEVTAASLRDTPPEEKLQVKKIDRALLCRAHDGLNGKCQNQARVGIAYCDDHSWWSERANGLRSTLADI